MLGIDPSRLLRADAIEAQLLTEVVREAHEYRERLDRNLARMIVSEYAEAQKRGRRGRH